MFLRDSLTGNASQVLWEISDETGHDEIVRLLRNRFGNSNQTERYRAELHARRRKRGESVQAVYQDICRLMALGFPGHSGELFEVIARDAFLNSLGDSAFRIRVLDQQPKTLDDVLAAVVRMEAYSDGPVADDDNFEKKMVRVVSPARESDADKRLRELEEHVERQNQEIRQLRESANRRSPSPYPRHKGEFPDNFAGGYNGGHRGDQRPPGGQSCFNPNFAAPNASGPASWQAASQYTGGTQWAGRQRDITGGTSRGRGTGRRQSNNRLPRDVCTRCRQRGHWRAQCTATGYRTTYGGQYSGSPGGQRSPGGIQDTFGGAVHYGPPNGQHGDYYANTGSAARLIVILGESRPIVDTVISMEALLV